MLPPKHQRSYYRRQGQGQGQLQAFCNILSWRNCSRKYFPSSLRIGCNRIHHQELRTPRLNWIRRPYRHLLSLQDRQLWAQLISLEFYISNESPKLTEHSEETPRLWKMISNEDFTMKGDNYFDYKDVEVSIQDENELTFAIKDIINRGSKSLPKDLRISFRELVLKFKIIFRTRIGNDPSANIRRFQLN